MRTINEVIEQLDNEQAQHPELTKLNSPSQTSIATLWKSITATVVNFLEQLQARFKSEIQQQADAARIASDEWLKSEVLKFQYSATDPQAVTLINFIPGYAVVNPELQIISRCAVKTLANKTVSVKVAKGEPPEALTGPELTSLQEYLGKIGFAGVQINTFSYDPDELYLKATISYNGQYSAVIQDTVMAAINQYFEGLPFNGQLKVGSLEDFMQTVPGVTDIVIEDLALRASGTAFSSKTYLVQGSTTIYPTYPTFAGYVIGESTAGETLADQLTFIAA
jgi:hypothetical protein